MKTFCSKPLRRPGPSGIPTLASYLSMNYSSLTILFLVGEVTRC